MPKYIYKGKEYFIIGKVKLKHPETREWVEAVEYIGKLTDDVYVREAKEFYERFRLYVDQKEDLNLRMADKNGGSVEIKCENEQHCQRLIARFKKRGFKIVG